MRPVVLPLAKYYTVWRPSLRYMISDPYISVKTRQGSNTGEDICQLCRLQTHQSFKCQDQHFEKASSILHEVTLPKNRQRQPHVPVAVHSEITTTRMSKTRFLKEIISAKSPASDGKMLLTTAASWEFNSIRFPNYELCPQGVVWPYPG